MNSKELQKKYNELKDRLTSLEIEAAKVETQLDTLMKAQADTENKILTLANVKTLIEAKEKRDKLEEKIDTLIAEAEELLND